MAEAVALVGLAASIVSLVDVSAKVVSRLCDFTSNSADIPESFRSLWTRLPLLTATLQDIQSQAETGHIPDDTLNALNDVIGSTSKHVSILQIHLTKILPSEDASKLERALKALKSVAKEDQVQQAFEKIHKNIAFLILYQTTRHVGTGDRILEELSKLNVALPALSKLPEVIKSLDTPYGSDQLSERQEKESQCHLALYTSNYKEHKDRIPVRAQDTCYWFLQSPKYASWRESRQTKILWVTADPGCGKSVLAKCLVDENLHGPDVCYFFFKSDLDEQNNLCTALCAMLHQLFDHHRPLLKHAMKDFLQKGSKFCREPRTLWDILVRVARDVVPKEIICVLDAIDECEPSCRERLLQFFADLCCGTSGTPSAIHNMKFLITSCRVQSIERKLSRLDQAVASFHASEEVQTEIEAEISQFLRREVQSIGRELCLEDSVRLSLEDKLTGTVNRTYLWLHLILDEIRLSIGVSRTSGLHRIIETLPMSVTEAYQKILLRASDPKRATDVLRILQSCRRLLTVGELNQALAVGDTKVSEPEEDDEHFRLTIQHQCGLFITTNLNKVDFIHTTAKDFLESRLYASTQEQNLAFSKVWGFPIQKSLSHEILARKCITYLSTGDWFNSLTENEKRSPLQFKLEDFPFLHYATFNWAEHVLMGSEERLLPETLELLLQAPRIDFLFRLLWLDEQEWSYWNASGRQTPCHTPAILAASYLGLEKAACALIEEQTGLHSTNDRGATALHLAVWKGKRPIARILLEAGLDLSKGNEDGNTALHIAALEGHWDLVDELLNHGASINTQNNDGQTSLHLAAAKGNNEVIQFLLDRGADLTSSDVRGRTVLHHAIDNKMFDKNPETVQLLLNRGITAQEPDIDNMTPLHLAVQCSDRDIAEALLQYGFSIDIPVKRRNWVAKMVDGRMSYSLHHPSVLPVEEQCAGYTPLHAAALFGSPKMVKFLLLQGANPNAQGDLGETPLHLALRKKILKRNIEDAWTEVVNFAEGSLDMIVDNWDDEDDAWDACRHVHSIRNNTIKILLDCPRFDVFIRNQKGEGPLHAIPYGDDNANEYVAKLVERGSDVNLRNDQGETAIHLAVRLADYQSLEVFFQHQVDLLAVDNLGRNVLHHACCANRGNTGRKRTIQALLRNDAGLTLISSVDHGGQNCLHHQVSNSPDVDIVQMLLDAGADVCHLDNDGQSPLVAAIESGPFTFPKDVIPVLLQAGADPQETVTDGRNLAHLATLNDFLPKIATFELLMDHGVRIDAMDTKGRTVLHHAAIAGTLNQEMLHVMTTKWGIDINARDCDGRTALDHAVIKNSIPHHRYMFNRDRWDKTIGLLSNAGANESSYRILPAPRG